MPNYCKYYKEKQQVSIDGGQSWTDTGIYRTGSLYETESMDCGSFAIQRYTPTGYTCDGYDRYVNLVREISYDGGQTWEATEQTKQVLVQKNSPECGYTE